MDEVWKSGLQGENVTLWCFAPRYKNDSDDSNSDEGMTLGKVANSRASYVPATAM